MVRFDFSSALKDVVGERGIDISEILRFEWLFEKVKENIIEKINHDYYPLLLPRVMKEEVLGIENYAGYLKEKFDNFVVVGMGGSSLGNIMLHNAINGANSNIWGKKKVYFFDNVDPESISVFLENIDLSKTVFSIITKSGDTSETIQNFLVVSQFLQNKGFELRDHLIFITDPEKGFLRRISGELQIRTFSIPALVGGRYSVLSQVGLLSASFEGINIKELLEGAEFCLDKFLKERPLENPSILLAFFQYKLKELLNISTTVVFSYSDSLYQIGEWYKQLLAESIGKRFSRDGKQINLGLLPVPSRGSTDQHSVLQLFMEGPFDKLIIFLYPLNYRNDFKVTDNLCFNTEEVKHLLGKQYSELIKSELKATRASLIKNQRPNISIELDSINEFDIGKIIFILELSVLSLGELFNVNPIDQPAVELGKIYTFGLMGREGYEKEYEEFEKIISSEKRFEISI